MFRVPPLGGQVLFVRPVRLKAVLRTPMSDTRRGSQRFRFVGALPGEAIARAAKVAVRCGCFVDGASKIELADNLSRRRREVFANEIRKLSFTDTTTAARVHAN